MKDVTIIIPSIRWEPFTEQCVATCNFLFPESKIILVLDEIAMVKPLTENLTVLIQSGFISKKRNAGVKAAETEFIALIDSDAYPHKNWLTHAVNTLKTDKSAGMTGGPNVSPPSQERSRSLVGMATRSWMVAGKWRFYKSEKSVARYCDNLPSCNLILRKSLYLQLNGMNEDLEVGEDTDLCARVIASGHRVYFNPQAVVYHHDRKIPAYLRQRMVRGAGVYLHVFGNSAQKKNLYTYLMLQPAATLLFWLSFPIGFWWYPWLYVIATAAGAYVLIILIEAFKLSERLRYMPMVGALILAGNILPGVGFILKAFRLLPSLQSFYRNDQR